MAQWANVEAKVRAHGQRVSAILPSSGICFVNKIDWFSVVDQGHGRWNVAVYGLDSELTCAP